MTLRQLHQTQRVKMRCKFFVFDGFKRVISVIKYQEFMPDPSDPPGMQRQDLNVNCLGSYSGN
jgi:hypothetical protein